MGQQGMGVPQLVVIAPDSYRGHRIELAAEYMTVGREPTCDVRIDDPHVSRTHAALQRRGDSVYVQDLGSSGGTFVNGRRATRTELHQGDIVAFATVQARFEARPPVTEQTRAMPAYAGQVETEQVQATPRQAGQPRAGQPPAGQPRATPVPAGQAHYSIGQQDAQVISNVGRDQYNAHVQQVIHQRDSFLRDIAATKTKARWLVWLGLLLFVAGFAVFAAADLSFMKQVLADIQSTTPPPAPTNLFGRPIFGIPSGLLGWAVAAIGALMLVIGIVLHIVATSRRRRVERDYPLPVPWPPNGPPGRAR